VDEANKEIKEGTPLDVLGLHQDTSRANHQRGAEVLETS